MSMGDTWYNPDDSFSPPSADDGGIGNPGPPPQSDYRPPDNSAAGSDNTYAQANTWEHYYSPEVGEIGQPGPPPQDTYTDTTTKRAQQAIDGGIGNPGPPPADQMPTPAGQDNRSWWERGKDLLGSAAHEIGDLAGIGPMALKDTIDAGNRPWEDPGAFLKDAYGSAAGTVANTVKDAFDVGSRIQGSAAIAANDLRRGNFGQFANDINPASNAYYAVTGDQAPWMGDTEYTTRNVVSRNPAAAILPGTGGSGNGPQVVPDNVPIIGGDSLYDLPIVGGLARGEEALRGSITGNARAQGPSLDVGALQNDIANGMSFDEAAQKYKGSVGAQIVSDLINPVNFVEVPGLGEAVASIFETKTGRVLDEIAQQAKQAGGWTPELAAEGKQALAGSGNLFDLSKPNQVGQLTETQAGGISGLNRVSTAQDTAAILYDGAARIAEGKPEVAGQWAAQFADQFGSTPEGVLDTMQRTADGMKYSLESKATTPVRPDSIARALDEKAQGVRDFGSDLKNVYVREAAAKLRVDLDRLTQQTMSADPAVAARGLEAKQAVAALASRDIVKDDLRAGWYAEAGYKLPGTENQLTQGMQGLFSIVRGLMLAGSAPPLALQKFSDEWFRALTQGTVGVRASDTAIGQALARFTEKRNLLGQGERAQGFLDRGTVGNLVRNDVLPPSAALADVNPLTFRGAFTGQNRYGEAIRPGERFQALASPVDKWNQSLISAPTQHVVLNALYQDTRRLTGSAELAARRVAQAMQDAGYSPELVQQAYQRARTATNPGDILNIGTTLPPVVPESGMAKGTAIPTARDLEARGKNLTPQVLQAIQESGGQPGLLREVARPPEYTPAQMASSANANERRAAQWANGFDRNSAEAKIAANHEKLSPVPADVLQTADRMGIDTNQTAGQLADEIAAQRPVGINRGTSAGAAMGQPLPKDIAAENQRQIAALKEIAGEPTTPIPTAAQQLTKKERAAATDAAIRAAGGDLSAVSRDDFIEMSMEGIRNKQVDYGKASRGGNIGARGRAPTQRDRDAAGAFYDSVVAEKAGVSGEPVNRAQQWADAVASGSGVPAMIPRDVRAAAADLGLHVEPTDTPQSFADKIRNRGGGIGEAAGGGGGGMGIRQARAPRGDVIRQGGEPGMGGYTMGSRGQAESFRNLQANLGGTPRTRSYGESKNAPRTANQGALDLAAGTMRGRITGALENTGSLDRYLGTIDPNDLGAIKLNQVAANTEIKYAEKELAAGKHAGNEAAVYHDLAEMDAFANRLAEMRAKIDPEYTSERLAQDTFGPRQRVDIPNISIDPRMRELIGTPQPFPREGSAMPIGNEGPPPIGNAGAPPIGHPGLPESAIPLPQPRDTQALEAARGRAQAGIREAAFARGTGDQAAVQAGLERGYRIVGNNADQTTAGAWMKNGVGGVTPPVLPFAPFHIHSAQFWAQYFASHPALALGMAQVLQNFDDYGTLKLPGGNTVAGLIKMTTGLHVLDWAQKAYEYAQDGNAQGGNNLLQQGLKNLNYNVFGNNAFVRPFEYISGPMASLTQRTTNPLLDRKGRVDYETKQPLVDPADMLREYGSMNGTTGVGQRLNDLAGNPLPRNVISGLTNPGQAGGNLLQRGTDTLFGVNRQEYNPDLAAAHALGFVADQMGLDKYAAERAYYAPQTPQEIALGKQLHDAVNVRLDTQAMGKIAPLQANAAQSAMEAKGIYAPKNEKGYMLDMPIGAGGFTGKDLLNQPGNYYDTLDKITAAKAQYGDNSPQVKALQGELAKIRAADVAQAPGPLGQYFDTLNKENLAKYGDQTFRGKLNPQEQNAYDAFNDLKRSPDYKARTALEQQAAEANKGKDALRGSAERNAYSDFYRQHGDELTRLNNIVSAAEKSIEDRFGVNPKELANRASVAAGYGPVYADTTIQGQKPVGGVPSTSNQSQNASLPRGNTGTSGRSASYSGGGKGTGSGSTQATRQAGNDFFDLYKTITDKGDKAAVLRAFDRAGITPFEKGTTAAEYRQALAVAKDALNTKRAVDQIDAGRRSGGNQSSSRALSLAELSALMQRTTGIGPAAGDRAMLGGGYSAPAPTRTTQPTRTYNLPYPGKKKQAA